MPAKSTPTRYGSVAVGIHWSSAFLVMALLVSGFRADDTDDLAAKAAVLRVHAPLGIAILTLTLARILWWWLADRKPQPVSGMPILQARTAKTIHLLFYVVILGMTASGLGMLVISGAWAILFTGAPGPLPDFWDYWPRLPHRIGARVMIALFLIHTAAALHHQFIRRDRLLRRMWF